MNNSTFAAHAATPSPLVLADRLISLAQDADRAGYVAAASNLVTLALAVFDETPAPVAH